MSWLLRDGEVLAALEIADGTLGRMRGLLGRDGVDGGFLLKPGSSVHTIGMRFPIDVAFCNKNLEVVACVCMAPNRVGRPRLRARQIIEAEAGAFERWRLRPGDQLEIKE